MNDINALPILIDISIRNKIYSNDYYDFIIEIAKYVKRKEVL